MPRTEKRHFETFDALRFFAFLKVFLLHLPLTAFPLFNFLKKGGGIGVMFFFVLSGFLITYIILEEKTSMGKLNFIHFFTRRAFRIWPLYYLMVAFAFATPYLLSAFHVSSSSQGYRPNWLMSLTFLENYKMMAEHTSPNVSPLGVMWSLCIEEHFYLIWGLSLFFLKVERVPLLILVTFVVANISRVIFYQKGIPTSEILTNIDFFGWGALPAWLLIHYKEKLEDWILATPSIIKWIMITIAVGYTFVSPNIAYRFQSVLDSVIFGLLFTAVLMLTLPRKGSFRISDSNILSKLGLYTYGLYMYHTIVLNFLTHFFHRMGISLENPLVAVIFSMTALMLTIAISILSYRFFERYFLRLKKRYY